jgi:serine/threonine-protein kinase RsbW
VNVTLPAQPESVATARREVAALGARLGLDQRQIDDLRTLVSEACTNAAVHAYGGPGGTYELHAVPRRNTIVITVMDRGDGIRPRPMSARAGGRLGLLLMAALAAKIEISERAGGGTKLSLVFSLSQDPDLA